MCMNVQSEEHEGVREAHVTVEIDISVGHVACVNVGRRARASVSAPDPQRRRLGSNEDVLPEGL